MPKIDIEKFKSDPAFAQDREFLDNYFTDFLMRKEEENKRKLPPESESIFDRIFGSTK